MSGRGETVFLAQGCLGCGSLAHLELSREAQPVFERILELALHLRVDGQHQARTGLRVLLPKLGQNASPCVDLIFEDAFFAAQLIVVEPLDACFADEVGALHARPGEIVVVGFADVAEHMRCQITLRIAPDRLRDHGHTREVLPVLHQEQCLAVTEVVGEDDLRTARGGHQSFDDIARRLIQEGRQPLDENVEGFFLHKRQIDDGRQRRPGARQQCPVSVEDVPPGGRRVHQPNLVFRSQRLVILGWGDLDDPESQEKDPEHGGDDDPDDADPPTGIHNAQLRWLGRRAARTAHRTGAAKITL